MNTVILSVGLVSCGIFIMVLNIIKFFSLAREIADVHSEKRKEIRILLAVYLFLLIFFLIGYMVVGVSFFIPILSINNILVGFIFFFGGIFVYIGITMQIGLSSAVKKSNLEVLHVLINAVEARDPNLNGHSQHVAKLSMLIYSYLPKGYQHQIDEAQLEYAAMMHDIGKLGIPEEILNKNSQLSEEEWLVMKDHPSIGKEILREVDHSQQITEWILYHHEHYDGNGYYGLVKDEIPLAARIIAVADTYSAITMERSYRKPRTYEEAVDILGQCSGSQFDPTIVAIFLKIAKEQVINCMPTISTNKVVLRNM